MLTGSTQFWFAVRKAMTLVEFCIWVSSWILSRICETKKQSAPDLNQKRSCQF